MDDINKIPVKIKSNVESTSKEININKTLYTNDNLVSPNSKLSNTKLLKRVVQNENVRHSNKSTSIDETTENNDGYECSNINEAMQPKIIRNCNVRIPEFEARMSGNLDMEKLDFSDDCYDVDNDYELEEQSTEYCCENALKNGRCNCNGSKDRDDSEADVVHNSTVDNVDSETNITKDKVEDVVQEMDKDVEIFIKTFLKQIKSYLLEIHKYW